MSICLLTTQFNEKIAENATKNLLSFGNGGSAEKKWTPEERKEAQRRNGAGQKRFYFFFNK